MRRAFILFGLLLSSCDDGDSDPPVVDAAPADPDAALVDAAVPDASVADAASPDATIDAGFSPDAAVPDAGTTTVARWEASDGLPSAACPAWTLVDTAEPEAPVIDAGSLYIVTDGDGEMLYYGQSGELIAAPSELVIEARLRVWTNQTQGAYRAAASIIFRLPDPMRMNLLLFHDNGISLNLDDALPGSFYPMDTTLAHDYRIVVTGNEIQVLVDGEAAIGGQLYPTSAGTPGIFFGDATTIAHGSTEWLRLSHNALSPTACP